jgi:hypothetical protein
MKATMTENLISKQTRIAFREHLVDPAQWVGWTVSKIADLFDAADVRRDETCQPACSGQRRTLVEQYYATISFARHQDVRRILNVYEAVLRTIEENLEHPDAEDSPLERVLQRERARLTNLLKRDGWEYSDGELRPKDGAHALADLERHAARFDLEHIRRAIERLKNAAETDPPLAIGTAKELVESCCKTILDQCGIKVGPNHKFVPLVKETAKALKLTADDVQDAKRGADIIRQLLHKLAGISSELGELRNLYGTGHGKNGRSKALQPRHARLAVGTASTLVMFLFETHVERDANKAEELEAADA